MIPQCHLLVFFFFFTDTATTEIYTLSLHDALPIWAPGRNWSCFRPTLPSAPTSAPRSEEHTSALQSRFELVCRLLLEKKKEQQRLTFFLTQNQTIVNKYFPK